MEHINQEGENGINSNTSIKEVELKKPKEVASQQQSNKIKQTNNKKSKDFIDRLKNIPHSLKFYWGNIKQKNFRNIPTDKLLKDANLYEFRTWWNPFKTYPLYILSQHSILIENLKFKESLQIALSYFKVKKKKNLIWKKLYYVFPHKDLKVNGFKFFYHENDDKFIKYITDQNEDNTFSNYDIKVDRSGVFLKLISEIYNKNITIKLLRKKLDEFGITSNSTLVEKIVSNKRSWIKIRDKKSDSNDDGKVFVTISDDALQAYITKTKPTTLGREIDEIDTKEALKQARVVYGINQEKITEFVKESIYDSPVLIATSNEEMGGYLSQYEELYRTNTNHEQSHKEENLLFMVEKDGYILKKKNHAEKEDKSFNVYGKVINIKKSLLKSMNAGENTYFDEEGNLRASISGILVKLENTFHVYEVLKLEAVNSQTGDINHNGSILVEKNVEDGFNIKATGSIHVKGNVGASTLEAHGNIIINKGVAGSDKAILKSKSGSIHANYIQNATIHCKGKLIIETLLNSCKAWVGDTIIAKKPKGSIRGGEFYVHKQIIAQNIGSVAGWHTLIDLGTSIEDIYRIDALKSRIKELKKEIINKKKDFDNAPQYRGQNRQKLQNQILNNKTNLDELQSELNKHEKNKLSINDEVKVLVHGSIHPGVKIQINNLSFENKYLRSKVEFSVRGRNKKNIFMKKI